MVTRFNKSATTTRLYDEAILQRVAVGAATAQSAPIDAIEVMLCASTRCFVLRGVNPVVTPATGFPLEAGEKFHMQIDQNDRIAVIRDTADGFVHIVPVK